MKKTTLVILAAGIGSRFGGGIKQLAPVGPSGEIIMDYSIHDALEAGFNDIVFIIRRDLEADFKEIIGRRIEKICPVKYAYQELDLLPDGYSVPEGRKKPWGTGHAVLACRGLIEHPFVVINADDYYGKEAFVKIHDFLVSHEDGEKLNFCMAGFILKNTLSENGGVTRGVCSVNADGYLTGVTETHNIVKTASGAAVENEDGSLSPLDPEANVSMNMWGMTPAIVDILDAKFKEFLSSLRPEDLKAEFYLPVVADELLREGRATIKVLPTSEKWFGVTYKEDKAAVMDAFADLIARGVYKKKLFD